MSADSSDVEARAQSIRGVLTKLRWWDVVFVAVLCAVVAARFVVLRGDGVPPTIDAGNWLAFADGMFGGGGRSSALVYPPVVPLLADSFVRVFGLVNGVSLLGALSSVAPALGVYASLRYLRQGFGALVAGLLLLGASAVGEATAWGGFPQLIGFGLTPIVLLAVDRWLRTFRWTAALAAGVLFALLMATSHFVALPVALAICVMVLLAFFMPIGAGGDWRRVLLHLGLMALPAIPLVPVYLSLSEILSGPPQSFLSSHRLSWSDLPDEIEFLYRAFPLLWRMVVSVLVVTPLFALYARRQPAWRLLASLLVGVAAATILVREGRFLYFVTMLGAIAVGFWIEQAITVLRSDDSTALMRRLRSRSATAVMAVVLLAICGWQLRAGLDFFRNQVEYYGILTPGLVAAIDYVDQEALPTDVLAIPSLNDTPVGWWVEALTERRVIYGSPLRWLAYEDELERATLANEIFEPGFPTSERLERAQAEGIAFILIPKEWTFYNAEAIALAEGKMPGLIVLSNDDAVVLAIR